MVTLDQICNAINVAIPINLANFPLIEEMCRKRGENSAAQFLYEFRQEMEHRIEQEFFVDDAPVDGPPLTLPEYPPEVSRAALDAHPCVEGVVYCSQHHPIPYPECMDNGCEYHAWAL